MDDRLLVQKLLVRDEDAEAYFFRTYRVKLYKVCVYVLGYQDPEAEDVTQEAFIIALRKLPQFEFRSSLYTWLYRICVRLCYERLEKRDRQVLRAQEDLEFLVAPLSVARHLKQEENQEKKRMLEILEAQKAILGHPCQKMLEMRDAQEKSYAQISDDLRVPIGTVMSRLARCKEALKKLMLKALEGKQDV